jgi:hypothetical protein
MADAAQDSLQFACNLAQSNAEGSALPRSAAE